MTNKYTTIDELRSAKRRLYFKKEELEIEIKNNFAEVKHSYSPSGIYERIKGSVKNGVSHYANGDSNHTATAPANGIVNDAASTVLDLLVNGVFMRRSSYIKKFIMTYAIHKYGPSLIENASPVVRNLIVKSGLMKYFSKEKTAESPQY